MDLTGIILAFGLGVVVGLVWIALAFCEKLKTHDAIGIEGSWYWHKRD